MTILLSLVILEGDYYRSVDNGYQSLLGIKGTSKAVELVRKLELGFLADASISRPVTLTSSLEQWTSQYEQNLPMRLDARIAETGEEQMFKFLSILSTARKAASPLHFLRS